MTSLDTYDLEKLITQVKEQGDTKNAKSAYFYNLTMPGISASSDFGQGTVTTTTADGKVMIGKYVSKGFKEVHKVEWRVQNDIISQLTNKYRTEARWNKAVMHLRERGELTLSPKDIGSLMKEVNIDVLDECTEEIKEELFKWAWKKVSVTGGLPEWYKRKLLEEGFAAD